ncbi:MAG: branched-chain amino acid ABC transporter ATP-binding protein/permease [Burkholderiaceae bacterium]|jgi:branched-chain amino acid transport system permease protein|nr:MAG: branched-chain amino acid ABC transporter ATP-binding protein/permease [Burkholderiaceae bacterium]
MKLSPIRALVAVIVAAVLLTLPLFVPSFYVNLLVLTAIYGFVVTGMILLTGYTGLVSLGHAAFFGVGAYAAAVLGGTFGLNPWLSLVAGTAIAALSAYIVGLPLLRLSGHYLALATLAWGVIASTLFTQMAFLTGGPDGFSNVPTLSFFGLDMVGEGRFYYLVLIVAVAGALMLGALLNSRSGRAVRALASSEVAASSLGVNVSRLKLQVFVLSAAFAGLGGGLYAYFIAFIAPSTFDIGASIRLLTMTMIGGAHPLGGLVGAGIIIGLDNLLQDILPNASGQAGQVQIIIYGLALVILMIASPKGLAPLLRRIWNPRLRIKATAGEVAAPAPEPAELKVDTVSRTFGGLVAVNELSLNVKSGEIVGLIGPNGAGKTTAFNLMSGVLTPSSGRVVLNGRDVTGLSSERMARLGLTRTFQETAPFDMSVLENVMMGCYTHTRGSLWSGLIGLGRGDEARAQAEALYILKRIGLENVDAPASALSVGQRRQLEVARALALRPRVLLLDEPAAGLRFGEKRLLSQFLDQLRHEGIALLLVEHDMGVVMGLVDRLVVMNYGKTLANGEPRQVARNPAVIEAYLGTDPT